MAIVGIRGTENGFFLDYGNFRFKFLNSNPGDHLI